MCSPAFGFGFCFFGSIGFRLLGFFGFRRFGFIGLRLFGSNDFRLNAFIQKAIHDIESYFFFSPLFPYSSVISVVSLSDSTRFLGKQLRTHHTEAFSTSVFFIFFCRLFVISGTPFRFHASSYDDDRLFCVCSVAVAVFSSFSDSHHFLGKRFSVFGRVHDILRIFFQGF